MYAALHHSEQFPIIPRNPKETQPRTRTLLRSNFLSKVEGFVINQIKIIGQDPELVRETIKAAKDPLPEIKKLERERQRLHREKENLLDAIQESGAAVGERLAEVDRELQRVEAAKVELAPVVDVEELKTALEEFTPLWEVLYPQERVRIVELVVERVTFDSRTADVEMEMR